MSGTEGGSGAPESDSGGYWPNGARLAVSFSLMFEGGGQPISGAGGVIPDPIENGVPDLPTNAFFAYGHYEGVPRLLDLMDKHSVKLSSFMIGKAVQTHRISPRRSSAVAMKPLLTVASGAIPISSRRTKRNVSSQIA